MFQALNQPLMSIEASMMLTSDVARGAGGASDDADDGGACGCGDEIDF